MARYYKTGQLYPKEKVTPPPDTGKSMNGWAATAPLPMMRPKPKTVSLKIVSRTT